MYASSLLYKRETPVREGLRSRRSPAGQRIDSFILSAILHTVDVGYYAPAARTTLNLCVLAFLPPSKIGIIAWHFPEYFPSRIRRVRSATRLWVPQKARDTIPMSSDIVGRE